MNILVAGGCGFIGSHVVDQLLARGHNVKVFDRQSERFRMPLKNVEYKFHDLNDRTALQRELRGIDAVIHLISTTFPGTADQNPQADVEGNLIGTLALLEAMLESGVSRLVFLSSGGTVYGRTDAIPIKESHALRPINSYGIVKASIEHYLNLYQERSGISAVAIRAANPYGPRQGHTGIQGVVSTFLNRIILNEPIEVWGDGSIIRDYVHVRDLAEFCADLVSTNHQGPYNIGSGQGLSVLDVLNEIGRVTQKDITPIFRPSRKIDVPYSVLDISKAFTDCGWKPKINFESGLHETWDWVKKNSK